MNDRVLPSGCVGTSPPEVFLIHAELFGCLEMCQELLVSCHQLAVNQNQLEGIVLEG